MEERSVSGESISNQATSHFNGKIQCILSANTNVAVDRVLEQLILRGGSADSQQQQQQQEDGKVHNAGAMSVWPDAVRLGAVQRVAKGVRGKLVLPTASGESGGVAAQIADLMKKVRIRCIDAL